MTGRLTRLAWCAVLASAGCRWGDPALAKRLDREQATRRWLLLTTEWHRVYRVDPTSGRTDRFCTFPASYRLRRRPWPHQAVIESATCRPDGRLLAYVWRTADPAGCELAVVDTVTGARRVIMREEEIHGPAWSRRADRLAFLGATRDEIRTGRPASLYVYDWLTDGLRLISDQVRLGSVDERFVAAPWWAKDDRSLWVTSAWGHVARVDVATGAVREGPAARRTLMGSDERVIYIAPLTDARPRATVYRARPDGGDPVALFVGRTTRLLGAAVSPCGRFLAVCDSATAGGGNWWIIDVKTHTWIRFASGATWINWTEGFRGRPAVSLPHERLFGEVAAP